MPMSNSESRKRVAELAAGSGDETCCTKCPPGDHRDMRHGQLVAPVQPPAPDPDETCAQRSGGNHEYLPARGVPVPPGDHCRFCGTPRVRPAPPATTGPADEAEGLAVQIREGVMDFGNHLSSWQGLDAARAALASNWLEADRRAQQRIGAEKAWDEGAVYVATHGSVIERAWRPEFYTDDNPYRADRIAREGQA